MQSLIHSFGHCGLALAARDGNHTTTGDIASDPKFYPDGAAKATRAWFFGKVYVELEQLLTHAYHMRIISVYVYLRLFAYIYLYMHMCVLCPKDAMI